MAGYCIRPFVRPSVCTHYCFRSTSAKSFWGISFILQTHVAWQRPLEKAIIIDCTASAVYHELASTRSKLNSDPATVTITSSSGCTTPWLPSIAFAQLRPNVFDVGPPYTCFTDVLSLLGHQQHTLTRLSVPLVY